MQNPTGITGAGSRPRLTQQDAGPAETDVTLAGLKKLFDFYDKRELNDDALRVAHQAELAFPESAVAQLMIALAYQKRWDGQRAAAAVNRMLFLSHDHDSWVFVFAADVLLPEGEFEQAERALLLCLQRDPGYKQAILKLASIWVRQGAHEPATQLIDNVIYRAPTLGETGQCIEMLAELGQVERAQAEIERLQVKFGSDEKSSQFLDKVRLAVDDSFEAAGNFALNLKSVVLNSGENWQQQCREIAEICEQLKIERIVIWGFRSPLDHTHHWIHRAFFRAAVELCKRYCPHIEVVWADAARPCISEDKSALFISVGLKGKIGHADQGLPVNERHFYLIHQSSEAWSRRFDQMAAGGRCIFFDEFRGGERTGQEWWNQLFKSDHRLVFPWGSDLLPWEISDEREGLSAMQANRKESRDVSFVGSIWSLNLFETVEVIEACARRRLIFRQRGNFLERAITEQSRLHGLEECYEFSPQPASINENVDLVRRARYAPAYQGLAHLDSYIPCRILKNCSYGALGLTNNSVVADLLGENIVFDTNIESMFDKADLLSDARKVEKIRGALVEVRNKHTYVSRLHFMLSALAGNIVPHGAS